MRLCIEQSIKMRLDAANGIEKVRGSTPLISTSSKDRSERSFLFYPMICRQRRALAEKRRYKIRDEGFTVEYDVEESYGDNGRGQSPAVFCVTAFPPIPAYQFLEFCLRGRLTREVRP